MRRARSKLWSAPGQACRSASGHPAAQTHDYTRHGTTTLFAALDVLDGTVLGRCMQRHRHGEFIRFLNSVEAAVPAGKIVHVILDNYAAHKHPNVRAWLSRHPRWTFHFTPTSASWLNAVEGFFSALTRRRLRRGTFTGIVDLQAAIKRYIAEHNGRAKPFVWTKPAAQILSAVSRTPPRTSRFRPGRDSFTPVRSEAWACGVSRGSSMSTSA